MENLFEVQAELRTDEGKGFEPPPTSCRYGSSYYVWW